MIARFPLCSLLAGLWAASASPAAAQALGTFRFQLSPYCNVVSLDVTQLGALYRFEGFDDQCGATPRAAVTGLGVPNPDGTLEFGLTIVAANGPQHVDVTFSLGALGGPWRDGSGNTGSLVFLPAGAGSGPPRPAPSPSLANGSVTTAKLAVSAVDSSRILDGAVAAADINATEVQRRVSGACAAGQYVRAVDADGMVTCGTDAAGGGTITGVTAGAGLTGGGTTGAVSLAVDNAVVQSRVTGTCGAGQYVRAVNADGTVTCGTDAAGGGTITGVTAGAGLTGGGTTGAVSLAVDSAVVQSRVTGTCGAGQYVQSVAANGTVSCGTDASVALAGTGSATTAARSDHTHAMALFGNTAVGGGAMPLSSAVPGADFNTAVGESALAALAAGGGNTAVGQLALSATTDGMVNTAVGRGAMLLNTSGSSNVAVGFNALFQQTAGNNNVGVGDSAGGGLTTGGNNVAIGYATLVVPTSGVNNIAIGSGALNSSTGSDNIAIGLNAGVVAGSNDIYIGNGGSSESGTVRIGTIGTQTRAFVAGIRGVTTGSANAIPVLIDSAGQLGTVSSSRRFKDDIADLGEVSAGIFKLRPVRFRYKTAFEGGERPLQYGLIAEEVNEVMPELVAQSADGQIETVMYHVLPTLLLAEVQRLQRELDALRTELAALRR